MEFQRRGWKMDHASFGPPFLSSRSSRGKKNPRASAACQAFCPNGGEGAEPVGGELSHRLLAGRYGAVVARLVATRG